LKPDILIFSDLAIHERPEFAKIDPSTGLNTRLLEGLSILDQIKELVDKYEMKEIRFLGDLCELKDNIPAHILISIVRKFILLKVPIRFLMGNHDYKLLDYPYVILFDLLANPNLEICVITHPIKLEDTYYIPYQSNYEEFKEYWLNAYDDKNIRLVCFHQEIPGVVYESGRKIEEDFNLPIHKKVFYLSGHLHNSQFVNGIQFVGSPYPIQFGESNLKYVWLLDSKTLELQPIRLRYPQFLDFDINESISKETVQGNYIRLNGRIKEKDYDEWLTFAKTTLENYGVKGYSINVEIEKQRQIRLENKNLSDLELLTKYVEENNSGLDTNKLIEIGEQLLETV
jgi:hypothetical protein